MQLRVLSWNLFHGRDFPPDAGLRTWRSRILRLDERSATHLQVNRDLLPEFSQVLAGAEWDVALLQECPPRWTKSLASACGAAANVSLTSRNSAGWLRAMLARQNPDLIASNEGGANLTLVRGGGFADGAEVELREGPHPERRTMLLTRLTDGTCAANLHASTADELARDEVVRAAERAVDWASGEPVILGGDFNLRPSQTDAFDLLTERHGLSAPVDPGAIDHILARGLAIVDPPRAWGPEAREVEEEGLAIRLSDHAPVAATFAPG